MPKVLPVKRIPVSMSSGTNYNHLVFVRGYLNTLLNCTYKYPMHIIKLFYDMGALRNETTKISLTLENRVI